ncbi:glycosyl hydrolase family 3 N terminal domain-containing protein [Halenospora varia]|nr:glycosyl hydrolase family 3 N terminal domain-containing protein [Halenospora varia]
MGKMATINVDSVLSKLSDQEKVSLLAGIDFWHTKSFPEHGVPSLRLSDGPNGVRGTKFFNGVPAACFPCGTALASTFDQELLLEAGKLMGQEAKAKGAHVLLGPTINMQRGPLGGRGFESFSEDPVLAGLGAAALIKGIQEENIVATLKHFVCNDQEHEHNKVNSILTERALREIYLMPFQLAIREAKPKAIMTSYNKVNGIHAAEDPKLLRDILREEWGWKGMIMSDWFGTYSTSEAINAGLDLEMPGPSRWRGEAAALAASTNKIRPRALDDCAREVLNLVNECSKSGVPENAQETMRNTPETAALLRRLASESIVLLKNEKNSLPLKKDKKTLVIGPNANTATFCGGGSAALRPYYAVTPLEGITTKVGGPENVTFVIGAYSHKELPDIGPQLGSTLNGTHKGVAFIAYNDPPTTKDRQAVDTLNFETSSMMFVDYNNPRITGKLWYADIEGYLVADRDGEYEIGVCVYGAAQVFVNNKLVLDITEVQKQGSAFLGCGTAEEKTLVPMKKGETYHIRLEFVSAPASKLSPSGVVFGGGAVKIGGAWKIDPEEEIRKAVELAKEFDQVILCIGLNSDWESEGFDRPDMRLPSHLDALTSAVAEANPSTVVCLQSGTPVEMPWLPQVSALIQAWYGGNETGNGIADVLFGDVCPSGKLSLSYPVKNEDNPAFLNWGSEGGRVLYGEDVYVGYRWYEMLSREVNFPFGHGLSYTSFKFSDLSVLHDATTLKTSVKVKNTGARDGAQVVQVYVSQNAPGVRRPKKELKGFSKVFLKSGEEKSVAIDIPIKYACSYFDEREGKWLCKEGAYKVIVSDSSKETEGKNLQGSFSIAESKWWSGL